MSLLFASSPLFGADALRRVSFRAVVSVRIFSLMVIGPDWGRLVLLRYRVSAGRRAAIRAVKMDSPSLALMFELFHTVGFNATRRKSDLIRYPEVPT